MCPHAYSSSSSAWPMRSYCVYACGHPATHLQRSSSINIHSSQSLMKPREEQTLLHLHLNQQCRSSQVTVRGTLDGRGEGESGRVRV
ncbi:hypothetical protein J6590_071010 [Homalodisca vitripennis]|nr:hypothetical protein J6590_071010 [Homalodisca vitripennis]